MDATHLSFLFVAVGIIAFLYSSVGHAGASGYIAVMALWGLAATTIRPDCPYSKYSRRNDWLVSVLESWTFFLEIVLAFRGTFHTSGIFRRLSAIARSDPKNFDRTRSHFLRSPAYFSARGSGHNQSADAACRARHRWHDWIFVGTNRHRRRNLSHAGVALFSMGEDSPGCSCFRFVYIGQLDFRFGGILQCPSHHSVAWVRAGTGRYRLWRPRIISRQPSLSRAHHFSPARDCSHHRRIEIDFYEMISGRSCSFGARAGDHGFFL